MRLSTRGRFAITAMIDLALRQTPTPVPLVDLALRHRISLSYLEQMFARLRQQGVDGECGDHQHGDLAQRVQPPEVHQHHVDHIGAAAAGQCLLDEEGRDRQGRMARQQRIRQRRQADADGHRQYEVAAPAPPSTRCRARVVLLHALGHPAQAQQEQHERAMKDVEDRHLLSKADLLRRIGDLQKGKKMLSAALDAAEENANG